MGKCTQWWGAAVAVLLAMVCWGCEPEKLPVVSPPKDQTDVGKAPVPNVPDDPPSESANGEQPDEPPPPPTIPAVSMTKEMLETCLVRVDDVMPDGELRDLEGNAKTLVDLRGSALTVVCFWRSGETLEGVLTARAILGDLQELYDGHQEQAVQVVAINEGDTEETIAERVDEAGATFPILVDPEGSLFEEVATERLPRVYLLDAEGKILWFDIEYSMTSWRKLEKAIEVAIGEANPRQ